MQGPPGIEERLALVWENDEVSGRLARDAPVQARKRRAWRGLRRYGVGLAKRLGLLAGLLGVVLFLASQATDTAEVVAAGLIPAFIGIVVLLGVFAVLQFPLHAVASLFGRPPIGFRVTKAVLEFTHGPDETLTRSPEGSVGAILDRPGHAERHVLPLVEITSVEANKSGLELELSCGRIERFPIDDSVWRGDLEAFVRFVRERVAVAKQHHELRAALEPVARQALSSIRRVGSREG